MKFYDDNTLNIIAERVKESHISGNIPLRWNLSFRDILPEEVEYYSFHHLAQCIKNNIFQGDISQQSDEEDKDTDGWWYITIEKEQEEENDDDDN